MPCVLMLPFSLDPASGSEVHFITNPLRVQLSSGSSVLTRMKVQNLYSEQVIGIHYRYEQVCCLDAESMV